MSSHYTKDINGWIILDKPKGLSSNQALRKIQYELKAKKAGHIGTLDPFATGVLPLAFGEATKLIHFLEGNEKTYEFTLKFGQQTTTGDIEGEINNTTTKIPTANEIKKIIPNFIGEISQIPPKYSAIHINGQRAYDLARSGVDFEIPKRTVTIKNLELKEYFADTNCAYFSVTCSKGTYVRTLGEDIAKSLGSLGHLTTLRRTKTSIFNLSDTILLEKLKNMLYTTSEENIVLPVETFLCDITVIALAQDDAFKLKRGQAIENKQNIEIGTIASALFENKLVALVEARENSLFPIRVFNH